MGEKHWLGYYLSLSARGEGEREMGRTRRSNGRVHTPLHHVCCFDSEASSPLYPPSSKYALPASELDTGFQPSCFVSVIEMFGAGWSSRGVDNVGTAARIDLVQCIWETSMEGQDVDGRPPGSG